MSGVRARIEETIPGRPGHVMVWTVTRFGHQPAWDLLIEQTWSLPELAERIGVKHSQLYGAVSGRTVPIPAVREGLQTVLGASLEELFTKEALAATPGKREPW